MRSVWVCLSLIVVVGCIFAPVSHFQFVNFDDPVYVPKAGQGIGWALTSIQGANWFPLTRLSLLMSGDSSEASHLLNLALHIGATLLLFAFLHRATGDLWPSAFVALVFGIHPLHVESVAWVSERKDVLCAVFWFLALWLYAKTPNAGRTAWLVGLAFVAGLMSKPMIVTLPLLLLLMDFWPLAKKSSIRTKMPLFLLSVASAIVTFYVQRAGGAVRTVESFPIALRVANAIVTLAIYPLQFFWPSRLAVFYPYPAEIPAWQLGLSALFIAGVTAAAIRYRRTHPYLFTGWFWYLVSIAPVIGIVQVGAQARADRYMYVPSVGLGIVVAWGVRHFVSQLPQVRIPIAAGALLVCAGFAYAAAAQVSYWSDSVALFGHAVEVTHDNYLAEHNLGDALLEIPGRASEAVAHLRESLRIRPGSVSVHSDLAMALAKMPDHLGEAAKEARKAIQLDPNSAIPHNNLGSILLNTGQKDEAIGEFQAALRIDPDYAGARNNLEAASRMSADTARSHYESAMALAKSPGKEREAIQEFEAALRIDPNDAEAHNNLGAVLASNPERTSDAIREFKAALKANPNYAEAHFNLGVALANSPNRLKEAIAELETAYRLSPDPQTLEAINSLKRSR